MPGLVRPRDLIQKIPQLGAQDLSRLYSELLPRAMEMNPLKEWTLKMNPTPEDLAEILVVIPPRELAEIEHRYFSEPSSRPGSRQEWWL